MLANFLLGGAGSSTAQSTLPPGDDEAMPLVYVFLVGMDFHEQAPHSFQGISSQTTTWLSSLARGLFTSVH